VALSHKSGGKEPKVLGSEERKDTGGKKKRCATGKNSKGDIEGKNGGGVNLPEKPGGPTTAPMKAGKNQERGPTKGTKRVRRQNL